MGSYLSTKYLYKVFLLLLNILFYLNYREY